MCSTIPWILLLIYEAIQIYDISTIHEAVDEKLESTASYRKYKILDLFD